MPDAKQAPGFSMQPTPAAVQAWSRVWLLAWELSIESGWVIMLRLVRLAAGGPAAETEAARMISEKLRAQADLGWAMVTGQLGYRPEIVARRSLNHYRRKVTANRRRMTSRR